MAKKKLTAIGNSNWIIDLKKALEKRGIENSYQLWLKIGGSKSTATALFEGSSTMIRLETINRLHEVVGISPFEYLKNNKIN